MRKIWVIAVFCLWVGGCIEDSIMLHRTYQMDAGPHRYPVILNFDERTGQYWGTYINEYYGDFRLGERNGQPTIYFDAINATRLRRLERLLAPEKAYFDFLYGEKMLTLTEDELIIKNFNGEYIRFRATDETYW